LVTWDSIIDTDSRNYNNNNKGFKLLKGNVCLFLVMRNPMFVRFMTFKVEFNCISLARMGFFFLFFFPRKLQLQSAASQLSTQLNPRPKTKLTRCKKIKKKENLNHAFSNWVIFSQNKGNNYTFSCFTSHIE